MAVVVAPNGFLNGSPESAYCVIATTTVSVNTGDITMIFLDSAYPVLCCVLGHAALGKLGRLREFAGQVAAYRLLPSVLVRPAVLVVVIGELAATVLLVPPVTRLAGAWLATVLLASFLAAQVSAWTRGLDIDCGCFAGSDELSAIGPASITRAALLLILAVGTDAVGGTPFRPMELLVAPLLAVLVGLLPELTQRTYARPLAR
jgi:hypothetical protein